MTHAGSCELSSITRARLSRRRRTIRPASSKPTTLQLFLPRSIPNTEICIAPSARSRRRRLCGSIEERRVTIGPVNVLSLDDARRLALGVLQEFAHGKDPKAERRRRSYENITLRQA